MKALRSDILPPGIYPLLISDLVFGYSKRALRGLGEKYIYIYITSPFLVLLNSLVRSYRLRFVWLVSHGIYERLLLFIIVPSLQDTAE